MKKAHKIYLTSFLTITAIIAINRLTSISCPQIDVFEGDSLFSILKFFGNVILGILIWIVGFQISKKLKLKKKSLIIYFIILSLISTSYTVKKLWKSNFSESKELIKSICDKSSDDGMFYKAGNLTTNEYNYLIKNSSWLPKSPQNAKNIEINYYRDDFLGDYSLSIEIELPENRGLDSLEYPKWTKTGKHKYRFGGYQD